jgi:hypothetical protein
MGERNGTPTWIKSAILVMGQWARIIPSGVSLLRTCWPKRVKAAKRCYKMYVRWITKKQCYTTAKRANQIGGRVWGQWQREQSGQRNIVYRNGPQPTQPCETLVLTDHLPLL